MTRSIPCETADLCFIDSSGSKTSLEPGSNIVKAKTKVKRERSDTVNDEDVTKNLKKKKRKKAVLASEVLVEEEVDIADSIDFKNSKKSKFVCFVGNLPYFVDDAKLKEFLKMDDDICSIRMPTDVKTNKRKGFAFVEVSNKEAMNKLLLYHHSTFLGRKINCELTAGGGGNSKQRRDKITARNAKLKPWRKKVYERTTQKSGQRQ